MPIMDTVVGGLGSGIQPQDNPNPFAKGPSAAAQTQMNSLPAVEPPRALASSSPQPPQPEQASNDSKEVDDLFSKLQSPEQKTSAEQQDVDSLFSNLGLNSQVDDKAPIVDARKPDEGYFQYKMRSLPQELQFIGAKMRANLGTDPKQQQQAFESMYGTDNVKSVGKNIYFRPNPEDKFRKVDQTLYNGMVDFALFNALNAVPLAANVAAQGGTDAAIVAAAPETGGASLAGIAAGGAVGGAAESATRQGMQHLMNAFSDKPQDVTNDTLSSMAWNAVGAGIAKPIVGAARGLVSKLGGALGSAFPGAVETAEKAAGGVTTKLAMARNAFKQFVEEVYPHASTYENPTQFAENMQDLFGKAEDRLGSTISSIKNEVMSIADKQTKKVPMDTTIGKLKGILQDYGYATHSDGTMELADQGQLNLVKPDVRTALESLSNHYNLLTGRVEAEGGVTAKDMFSQVDQLKQLSKFDKGSTMSNDAISLYRDIYKSSSKDRNQFIDQMYSTSDSPFAKNWKGEFNKYHDQIDSAKELGNLLKDDGSRENFLNALLTGSKVDKANLIEGAANILEKDHPEAWNGLQGQMINHIIETNSKNGVVNGSGLAEYIRNPNNASIVDRLFTPKDKVIFQKMGLETSKIDQSGKMSEGQKEIIKKGVSAMFGHAMDAKQAVWNVMKGLGSSEVQVKYLLDKGFNDMIDQAEGPALRQKIIDGRRLMEGLTSKMKIVEAPSTLEKGISKSVRRYAPFIGTEIGDSLKEKFQPSDSGISSMPGTQ